MNAVTFSEQPLRSLCNSHFAGETFHFEPMEGGASMRRFVRVRAGDRSAVGMFYPDPWGSEEAAAKLQSRGQWPFLEIQQLLSDAGIRVPQVLAKDLAHGWVLLEDLTDQTLAAYVERAPERRLHVYRTAVEDVARAQAVLRTKLRGSVVAERRFDQKLLHWEIDHFRQWALEARSFTLSNDQAQRFEGVARKIAARVASMDYGFVHRDYQSRNLMVTMGEDGGERLTWIDFQDALLGPKVYDLVALLNDSYQGFTREFVEARLADYANACGTSASLAQLIEDFDVVTVQRKLKDAGRFVYIERNKQDASYLRFVEPTILKIRSSLARLNKHPEFADLERLLDEVLLG